MLRPAPKPRKKPAKPKKRRARPPAPTPAPLLPPEAVEEEELPPLPEVERLRREPLLLPVEFRRLEAPTWETGAGHSFTEGRYTCFSHANWKRPDLVEGGVDRMFLEVFEAHAQRAGMRIHELAAYEHGFMYQLGDAEFTPRMHRQLSDAFRGYGAQAIVVQESPFGISIHVRFGDPQLLTSPATMAEHFAAITDAATTFWLDLATEYDDVVWAIEFDTDEQLYESSPKR